MSPKSNQEMALLPHSYFRLIVMLAIIIGLLSLAVICFRWAYADVLNTQIAYHLDVSEANPNGRNVKHWRQARNYLDQVLSIRPQQALYLESAERFYQTLDTLETDAPEVIAELSWLHNEEQALKYARLGLQSMPSWPYLWKQLVLSKVTLRQIDQELTSAYAKAQQLGPWDKTIQFELAAIALENWDDLNTDIRQLSLKPIDHILSMLLNQKAVAKLFTSHPKMTDVCMLLSVSPSGEYPALDTACRERNK